MHAAPGERSTERKCRAGAWSTWLTVAALAASISITALAWAQASGPYFRPDGWKADVYGRAEGYPADRSKASQQKFLVGTFSLWDTLVPIREVATPKEPAPLARAPREPVIR